MTNGNIYEPDIKEDPNDIKSEESALGAIILSPEAADIGCGILSVTDFYLPAHQTIYARILSMRAEGVPVDPTTLDRALLRAGEHVTAGGAKKLAEIRNAPFAPASTVATYARDVIDLAIRRHLMEGARTAISLAGNLTRDVAEAAGYFSLVAAEQQAMIASTGGSDAEGRFPSLDWFAGFATDFSVIDWLAGRFMERGQQAAFVGNGKVGKSLFVLEWVWRSGTGRSFLGDQQREPIKVVYFDRENSLRDIITRAQALGATADELATCVDYRMFPRFSGSLDASVAAVAELLAIVEDTKADLVILDTVSRFISGKENDADTWLSLYSRVHAELKRLGVACVRLDHFGKDDDKGSRGSSAKSQDVDHVWEMTGLGELVTRSEDVETVVTQIRLKRTHTRSGLGDDVLNITRRGSKYISEDGRTGAWIPGRTGHALADAGETRQHNQEIAQCVEQLLIAGVPTGMSRDRLKVWAAEKKVPVPGKNDTLAEVLRALKARQK